MFANKQRQERGNEKQRCGFRAMCRGKGMEMEYKSSNPNPTGKPETRLTC